MTSNLSAIDAAVQSMIKDGYELLTAATNNRGVVRSAGSACGEPCSCLIWDSGPDDVRLKWGEKGSSKFVELKLHDHPLPLPLRQECVLVVIELQITTWDVDYDAAGSRVTTATNTKLKLLGIENTGTDDGRLTVMRTNGKTVETMAQPPLHSRERECVEKTSDCTLTDIAQLGALLDDVRKLLGDAID